MVANGRIAIIAQNIDDIRARIPGWRDRVPEPDQVAQTVVECEPVVHEAVQCFGRLGAVGTPPEPATFGFVQGAPDDGDPGGLESSQLVSDRIHIRKEEGVVGASGVGERGGQIEGCAVGIDAIPPGNGGVVDEIAEIFS